MPIRNPSWYAANATQSYPLDDAALLTDDAGGRVPSDVLVDLSLRWGGPADARASLGALAVTPNVVWVILLDNAGPLASVSLALPVVMAPSRFDF
jgi:hypothetical protein